MLSLQAKMCRQRLRRRVETALSSCPPEIRAIPTEPGGASTLHFLSSARPPLPIAIESSAFRYRRPTRIAGRSDPARRVRRTRKRHSRKPLLPSKTLAVTASTAPKITENSHFLTRFCGLVNARCRHRMSRCEASRPFEKGAAIGERRGVNGHEDSRS
jgi:hypothetical protein